MKSKAESLKSWNKFGLTPVHDFFKKTWIFILWVGGGNIGIK